MKVVFLLVFTLAAKASVAAQITGTLSMLTNGQMNLIGFKGFNTYIIDSCQIDHDGNLIYHTVKAILEWGTSL